MSTELWVNVLEEVLGETRPRVEAKMGRRMKVSRTAYDHPDQQPRHSHRLHSPKPTMGAVKTQNTGQVLTGLLSTHQILTGSGYNYWATSWLGSILSRQIVMAYRESYTRGGQGYLGFLSPNWPPRHKDV